MTGYDLSQYAAGEIFKLVATILVVVCLIGSVGWFGHMYYSKNNTLQTDTEKEAYKLGYVRGTQHGVLTVVNYDRKNAGEEPYATYEDFIKDLDRQHKDLAAVQEFISRIIKEKEAEEARKDAANKKYPKLWTK